MTGIGKLKILSPGEAMRVLVHPSIWPNISDIEPDNFDPPDDCIYLSVSGNDVFILEEDGTIHANVLPCERYRSDELGFLATKWFFGNTDHKVLKSYIPKKYENVINYARRCGYEIEDHGDQILAIAEREKWALLEN